MIQLLDHRTIRVLLTALLFAAVLYLVYAIRHTLLLVLFALLFAYLFEPIVRRIQPRVRERRGLAILIVYLAFFAALAVFGLLVGPRVISEGQKLGQSLPEMYEKISSGSIAWQIGSRHGWSMETQNRIQHFLAEHQQAILTVVRNSSARAASLLTNVVWIVLVPILAVFFLKDKRDFRRALRDLFSGAREQELVSGLLNDLDTMLARYVRAQLLLALISGVVYVLGLSVLRAPYALVMGSVGGLLEFVPLAGPAIAAVAIISVSFAMGYSHLIVLLLFLAAWRLVQDYVISPRLLGGKVELHPMAAIFAILAGGEIAGVIGIYLSIPAFAAVRIAWQQWRTYAARNALPVTDETTPAVSAE